MTDETDSTIPRAPLWNSSPSVKTRNVIQRSVTALLDELAPERVLKRVEKLEGTVDQYRTPTGCVLQAPGCAVSVSWFADGTDKSALGELHMLLWRGTVARRGTPRSAKNATLISEIVLHPIEPAVDECIWRTADGERFDTASLAAHAMKMLEGQIRA
jgi:hypothetical protein